MPTTPQYPDLKNKTVLITGGAGGIGRAMVEAFTAQEARVHFADVDREAGETLATATGGSFTHLDLRVESDLVNWIAGIAETRQPIDVLINNAARDPRLPLADTTTEAWDDLFDLNLRAYFIAAREAAPHMRKGSAVINFSSITVHLGAESMAAYMSTKAGAIGLTRSLARDLGKRGIRVNAITPGWILTERQKTEHVTEEVAEMLLREQSIPELNQPEEVAELALFLASDASRVVTGQEIIADRGWRFD